VEIEGHLHEVYNAMAASGTVNDKLNVLVYFEAIILNSNVANRLINSAFMNLLTKLLKNVKSPHLKLRLCSILGQLVRHSTVIGNEVAESGLAQLLSEVVSDKNEKVRRKAVASLGEFMFYAATQLDDEQADPVWNLAPVAIKSLVKCLSQGEDEVVRFYACKTIENITAQSISAGCNFATLEVATLLLNIYHTVTMDSFRTSAAVSVSHICKLNTTLFPTIFESITCKQFSQALLDGSQRIQQAFLTMINIALTQPYAKLNDTLQEDDTF
jgi:serine/threonine-protein kinase ULK4